jgi:hypothetical protein
MSSERQIYVLYSVESSSRILLPKVFGQCRGELHEEYRNLLRELGPATGTGMVKDYSSFFRAVNKAYGNNRRPSGEPFEANRRALRIVAIFERPRIASRTGKGVS